MQTQRPHMVSYLTPGWLCDKTFLLSQYGGQESGTEFSFFRDPFFRVSGILDATPLTQAEMNYSMVIDWWSRNTVKTFTTTMEDTPKEKAMNFSEVKRLGFKPKWYHHLFFPFLRNHVYYCLHKLPPDLNSALRYQDVEWIVYKRWRGRSYHWKTVWVKNKDEISWIDPPSGIKWRDIQCSIKE